MMDGLKNAHREAIVAEIATNSRVERAVLFGSRAARTNTVTSDVTIALFGDRLTLTDQARLAAALDSIPMAQSVDLILYNSIRNQSLRQHIRRHGVECFVRPTEGTGDHASLTSDVRVPESSGNWPRVSLNELVALTLSSVDKKSKDNEIDVRLCNYLDVYKNCFVRNAMDFMTATATEREIARCSLAKNDVVITKDSEKHDDIGVPALIRDDIHNLVCGYHLAILRPLASKILGPYLFYALSNPGTQRQFHSFANGVTRFGLRKHDIGLVEIPLPSVSEQRAIANILAPLDDKIELNRRMNETLEAIARALFKSWFVDFDPVRAKMEGRDTGLPDYLANLFPSRLVDSEMGEIPDGWEVGILGDLAKTRRRGIDPGKAAANTPYIGLQHMPRQSVALTDWGEAGSVSSRKFAFEVEDVLYGKLRPYFHKVGIAPVDGLCSTDIVVLNARIPKWSAFVLACVSSSAFVAHTTQTSIGTKMPRTSWQAMRTYELCRPPDPIASQFQQVVSPMLGRIVENVRESRTLADLRDTLLPRLISGQLRPEEAAQIFGATA